MPATPTWSDPMSSPQPGATAPEVPVPSLPYRVRPLGVRIAVAAVLVGLLVVCAAVWVGFGEETRAKFTLFQISTLIVLGLLIAATGHAVGRSRLDVRADGLTVVNGYRTHHYEWAQIVAFRLRGGAPWAELDVSDGTTVSVFGVQASDGPRAREAVRDFRRLLAQHSPPEPEA